jgi:hypothetical protein
MLPRGYRSLQTIARITKCLRTWWLVHFIFLSEKWWKQAHFPFRRDGSYLGVGVGVVVVGCSFQLRWLPGCLEVKFVGFLIVFVKEQ